jgi:hypothetical protein
VGNLNCLGLLISAITGKLLAEVKPVGGKYKLCELMRFFDFNIGNRRSVVNPRRREYRTANLSPCMFADIILAGAISTL